MTTGSALNKEFNRRLDELAGYFKTLESKKIAVLWRPFHEMNGDFFWWSFQDRFKELWTYTFTYLTTTKKCNNLLWVFGVNWYSGSSTGKDTPEYYYPGHQYVDVLGCDFYTEYGHSYGKRIHDALRKLGGGKPIAIAENGKMPDLTTLLKDQPYWVYWSTWWGFEGAGRGNTDDLYSKNYGLAAVITQDEVKIPTSIFVIAEASRSHGSHKAVYYSRSISGSLLYESAPCLVDIYSAAGKRIKRAAGNGIFTFDNIPAGTYLLRPLGNESDRAVKAAIAR